MNQDENQTNDGNENTMREPLGQDAQTAYNPEQIDGTSGAEYAEPAQTVEAAQPIDTTVEPTAQPTLQGTAEGNDPASQESTNVGESSLQLPEEAIGSSESTISKENSTTPQPGKPVFSGNKKLLVLLAGMIALLAASGVLAWFVISGTQLRTDELNQTTDSSVVKPKMGAILSVVDGTVEYSEDGKNWMPASTSTQLEEGYYIRTGESSRAVIMTDDGSAIRLDGNTTVILESLRADEVRIEQVEGKLYSRVVPSDRSYQVIVGETVYEALGTAFVTINKEQINGVQVYQSSVRSNAVNSTIEEGYQFYKEAANEELKEKITRLDFDSLSEDGFVEWNISQDEGEEEYSQRLGVLADLKQKIESRKLEAISKEAERIKTEMNIRQKSESTTKEESSTEKKVVRGTMTLNITNDSFVLNYTGNAAHGYKLVYSKKNQEPTYGIDESIYFTNSSDLNEVLSALGKSGKGKYYIRVCAYTANTESDPCIDYSSKVIINL